VKWLGRLVLALLLSLCVGLVIGTVIRARLERPVHYLGSALPAQPLHVDHTGAPVLDPRHHEQQIG
jgi:hypothetical protein